MKVIHVINQLAVGGAERLLVDSLPIMKQRGVDVKVVMLVSSGGPFEERLRQAGIEVEAFNLRFGEYDPRLVFRLHRYMREADVVHTHLFPSQYWAAFAHALSGKGALVTTEHSTSNNRARHWLTSQLDRWVYGLYDGVICISDATAEFMRRRAPRRVAITTIENGIRLPKAATLLEPSAKRRAELLPQVGADDFLLLQVARFSEQKNQDCVIRALQLLPENVHVAFAGYGVRLDSCKALAERLGVASRAHFLGMREDIGDLWSVADVGVMSSHWEGFGLAAVEGMAYGKPVVASDVPGLADVVALPELLFTPDDEHALADKVRPLLNNRQHCHEMGEQCRQMAQRYDITAMAQRYIDFYEQQLKNRKHI